MSGTPEESTAFGDAEGANAVAGSVDAGGGGGGSGANEAGRPGAEIDPEVLEELELWGGTDGGRAPLGPEQPEADAGVDHSDDDEDDELSWTRSPVDAVSDGRGYIVLVGTPIGNLGDLSPRASRALAGADVIYCEDTRHSRKLLSHAGITGVSLRSLHEHNEDHRIDEVLAVVAEGKVAAVVSDAGMPGISDPGSRLVQAAATSGVMVTVVPGPTAVITALVASGIATDRFCFEGFLPRSGKERRQRLDQVATEPRTSVIYEAPTRVAATLAHLGEACGGDRLVAVARELTKLHEEVWRGTLADGAEWASSGMIRGEVVLVLEGAPAVEPAVVGDDQLNQAMAARLAAGERTRGVVDDVAASFDVPRRRVYDLALALKGGADSPEE
jgi:16S rRNA (cytidine1402-2'-O)-methyltransferase